MGNSKPFVAVAAAFVLPIIGGCSIVATESSPVITTVSEPPPTIGLTTDLEGTDGGAAGDADVSDVDTVVMIGDSITRGAEPLLEERFESLGLDHAVESENAKRMASSSSGNPSGSSVAASITALGDGEHTDEVWVIALGTNDIGQYDTDDEIAAAVDEVLAEVPADVVMVWVDTWISGRPDQSRAVNAVIRQRLEDRGNGVLAPWTSVAATDGVLSADGVHPTSTGASVFADVVADTVARLLGR